MAVQGSCRPTGRGPRDWESYQSKWLALEPVHHRALDAWRHSSPWVSLWVLNLLDNPWAAPEYEQYPQMIMIEFIQDKVDLLNNYNVGQDVKVSINLRGREWTNQQGELKYFNSIQGWRIEKVVDEFESQLPPLPTKEDLNIPDSSTNEPDDLPF